MVALPIVAFFFLAGVLVTPVAFVLVGIFSVLLVLDGRDSEWVALYRILRSFVVEKGN